MSYIKVFEAKKLILTKYKHNDISDYLKKFNIRFESWKTLDNISFNTNPDTILDSYRNEINELIEKEYYKSYDVISIPPKHPQKAEFRKKFLSEHIHSEDEVRFFIEGKGLFFLHIKNLVFKILCERGDLISIPANTKHWFDMGENPEFIAIRFFNNPEGWVANYTESNIANDYISI